MHARLMFVIAILAATLAGGCLPESVQTSSGSQAVQFTGSAADYPIDAAGYKRVSVTEYAPDKTDMSVGYTLISGQTRIISTIYIYRKPDGLSLDAHYEQYRDGIIKAHPSATLMSEEAVVLRKNGKEYPARKAVYKIEDVFGNTYQELYSLLVLWEHDGQFGKLRTTAPIAQADVAEQKSMELLDKVNWLNYPAK
jgi:hypothetical protein